MCQAVEEPAWRVQIETSYDEVDPRGDAQAKSAARYLNLPAITFLNYANKKEYNARLPGVREAGLRPQPSKPDGKGEKS